MTSVRENAICKIVVLSEKENGEKGKVIDKYLLHFECGHETRDPKSIESFFCEKCKKVLINNK